MKTHCMFKVIKKLKKKLFCLHTSSPITLSQFYNESDCVYFLAQ